MNAQIFSRPDGQTRRCPFAAEIAAELRATGHVNVRIFAGEPAHRWSRALTRRALVGPATATLLPPGVDPRAIRWPGCEIVADVTGLPGDQVRGLAEALVRDGCELAFLTDLERGETLRIVPEEV